MTLSEIEAFVAGLENVQREESFGYRFFFVGDDHRLPFVTTLDADYPYDNRSNLDREGVFRVNIGVSRETFRALVGGVGAEGVGAEGVDYSVLNAFLPHPDYAAQHFICILNPAGENVARTQALIEEAHAIAAARLQRRSRDA